MKYNALLSEFMLVFDRTSELVKEMKGKIGDVVD